MQNQKRQNGYSEKPMTPSTSKPIDHDEVETIDPSYVPKVLKTTGSSIVKQPEFEQEANSAKILVLYCGGTIGMRSYNGVYSPEPNYLVPQLRDLPMFHDKTYPMPDVAEKDKPLVMPSDNYDVHGQHCTSKDGKRIIYSVWEYEPLLDSSNMTIHDYARLATDIGNNYNQYDGFVILHGTDTMGYTASALSFMMEHLGKPVILTGSQIPIFETRSDGRDNLLGALIMAGHYVIPEVMIYFNNRLFRGNRCAKLDSGAFDAFWSPNMEPLAKLEINIKVAWDSVFLPQTRKQFRVHTNLCPNVALLRLFPSITEQTVRSFLQPPMQGVVIQSYGAGNGPDAREDLLKVFREAADQGVIIINTTQCCKGAVSVSYATGKALLDAGVIPGSDMTAEAALTKLFYVLSKDEWNMKKKKKMMAANLRGEMSVATSTADIGTGGMDMELLDKLTEALKLSCNEEVQKLKDIIFPSMVCRAAKDGDVEGLQKLKKAGAMFHLSDYDGRTALHLASCEGHVNVVDYLLDNGASVHARDRYGHSPFDDAIRYEKYEVVKLLKQDGAHLIITPSKLGMMLCHATLNEGISQLKAWHIGGINLSQSDYSHKTALHVAAATGKEDIVEWLLEQGVEIDCFDRYGHTPEDEAKTYGFENIIKIIQKHKKQRELNGTK